MRKLTMPNKPEWMKNKGNEISAFAGRPEVRFRALEIGSVFLLMLLALFLVTQPVIFVGAVFAFLMAAVASGGWKNVRKIVQNGVTLVRNGVTRWVNARELKDLRNEVTKAEAEAKSLEFDLRLCSSAARRSETKCRHGVNDREMARTRLERAVTVLEAVKVEAKRLNDEITDTLELTPDHVREVVKESYQPRVTDAERGITVAEEEAKRAEQELNEILLEMSVNRGRRKVATKAAKRNVRALKAATETVVSVRTKESERLMALGLAA